MIIVDTNVISEFARMAPAEAVAIWFAKHNIGDLWTTAITEAEVLTGVALLPEGKRKGELALTVDRVLHMFEHRILPFDKEAAQQMPKILIDRRAARLQISEGDGLIAAIARAHDAAVATRNTADFAHTGIKIINPWNT